MEKTKTLLDLPVLPEDRDSCAATDVIISTYKEELAKVSSPNELKEFVYRWKNVWLLKDDEVLRESERVLVLGEFDASAVFDLLPESKSLDLDFHDFNVQVMASILVPAAFLMAYMLAHKYMVGHDLAMVRLYLDPFPEHENALRGWKLVLPE